MDIIIPLIIFPVLTIAAYVITLISVILDKYMASKSFIQVALLGNVLTLVMIYLTQNRLPMGGFLETCAEAALVMGLAYAFAVKSDMRRLALVTVSACLVLMLVSLVQGMTMHPGNYAMVSLWYQLTYQTRLLLNGFLLFSLLCLATLIFSKADANAEGFQRLARTSLIFGIAVYLIGMVAQMQWCFSVTGDIVQWDGRQMVTLAMLAFLILPLISQVEWFRQPKAVIKFNAVILLAVLAVNVMEWGGLA